MKDLEKERDKLINDRNDEQKVKITQVTKPVKLESSTPKTSSTLLIVSSDSEIDETNDKTNSIIETDDKNKIKREAADEDDSP